jgi:hypothetical protein
MSCEEKFPRLSDERRVAQMRKRVISVVQGWMGPDGSLGVGSARQPAAQRCHLLYQVVLVVSNSSLRTAAGYEIAEKARLEAAPPMQADA